MSPRDGEDGKALFGMVLAAGLGTRLRPLTDDIPKGLAPVSGRSMILYPLSWLAGQGIRDVVINIHHRGDLLEKELGHDAGLGLRISYSREQDLLGTGGGVGHARKVFGNSRLVLINSDTLIDAELGAMLRCHRESGAAATLATVPPGEGFTPVWVSDSGLVRGFGIRPEGEGPDDLQSVNYAGLAILDPELVDYLPGDRFAGLVDDGLVPALRDGLIVAAYPHPGYWSALDTLEMIRRAETDIREGRYTPPPLA